MPAPTVTNTFTNFTTADPSQVNQNFTDILNALTDGTKDFSISAFTCTGNVSFQGNVILGNASGDDISVTGSLASSIPIKNNNSFSIGSSTLGLSGIYLGAPSSRTTKLMAHQSLGASNTLTFPNGNGNASELLSTDGAGNLLWAPQPPLTGISTITTTATIPSSGSFIMASSAGGAYTATFPVPTGNTNKVFTIRKSTTDFSAITLAIATSGSFSENGATSATTTLNTIGETLQFMSDGANYVVISRTIPAVTQSFTGGGSWNTNTTYAAKMTRLGGRAFFEYSVSLTGAPNDVGLTVNMATGLTIDTARLADGGVRETLGIATTYDNSGGGLGRTFGAVVYNDTSKVTAGFISYGQTLSHYQYAIKPSDIDITFVSGDKVLVNFTVPVTGWKE